MITEENIIPIDDAIADFSFHLDTHPRTILSAGFGEGKTFFLDKCKSDLLDYEFITLYPVNYQVVSNEDIFELVKRDILFQLFIHDILAPTSRISQKTAISFFLSNPSNYFEWLVSTVASLDYPEVAAAKAVSKGYKFLKKAYSIYSDFCKSIDAEGKAFNQLWDKIESKGIYECDIITRLIIESITKWKKKNPDKKIVLLVEDLDRIDPAHLFRILNVLSAHIDYSYKYGISPSRDSADGNKFGFDNIVCVLDYQNLISIFRHFYGEYTSCDGYISKFSNKGIFKYSLSEQKCNYFYRKASNFCQLEESILRELIKPDVIQSSSMRTLNATLSEIDSQYSRITHYSSKGVIKTYPSNLLRAFVILRRFGIEDAHIIDVITSLIKKNSVIKGLVMPYYFLMENKELGTISFGEKRDGYLVQYNFSGDNVDKDFKYDESLLSGYISDQTYPTFESIVRFMLSKVGK